MASWLVDATVIIRSAFLTITSCIASYLSSMDFVPSPLNGHGVPAVLLHDPPILARWRLERVLSCVHHEPKLSLYRNGRHWLPTISLCPPVYRTRYICQAAGVYVSDQCHFALDFRPQSTILNSEALMIGTPRNRRPPAAYGAALC